MPADEREEYEKSDVYGVGARAGARKERKTKARKKDKVPKKGGGAAKAGKRAAKQENSATFRPSKNIAIKRGARTEPLGERLDYPGGYPVYLARYVLFAGAQPRAAMRFYNGSDAVLTGLRFKVTEKDGDGRIIAEYTLERRGLNAEKGAEFAVADSAVSADCEFLEASVESAFSDPYEYVVDGGGVSVRYGVSEEKKEFYFKNAPTCSVKKRKKILTVISLAAVIGAALIAAFAAWRTGVFDGRKTEKSSDINNKALISVTEDVET